MATTYYPKTNEPTRYEIVLRAPSGEAYRLPCWEVAKGRTNCKRTAARFFDRILVVMDRKNASFLWDSKRQAFVAKTRDGEWTITAGRTQRHAIGEGLLPTLP